MKLSDWRQLKKENRAKYYTKLHASALSRLEMAVDYTTARKIKRCCNAAISAAVSSTMNLNKETQ
jgi:hypothetical protein